ncbi:hypothetical protein ALC62_12669, partial [Cyphomyrmex costatus]
VDRSGACYRCGASGHLAGSCVEPLRCPACAESGQSAAHRIGSLPSCKAAGKGAARKKKGGGGVGSAAVRPPSALTTSKASACGAAEGMDVESVPSAAPQVRAPSVASDRTEAMEVAHEEEPAEEALLIAL